MRKVTTIHENDKTFYIVAAHDGYMAINSEWVDANGCLNRVVNGIQGHYAKTASGCIENLRFHLEMERLMSTGLSFNEACKAMMEKKGA